ncbi:MAG: hypothetical protein HOI33_08985 [Rhodospirillaceae bacterium]|nr:hypothetical protein [Rhodospirillaceae bacterium]MBT5752826.1 hypothetical protein [Rhodospirillaceae bacterium]
MAAEISAEAASAPAWVPMDRPATPREAVVGGSRAMEMVSSVPSVPTLKSSASVLSRGCSLIRVDAAMRSISAASSLNSTLSETRSASDRVPEPA